MKNQKDADVIISGGGPVGMGLAIELGQRGIDVLVIEKHPSPQRVPKGQNLTQRTMEHFRAWGAESELRAARTVPAGFGIGGLTSYGTLLGDYHYDWMKRELVHSYYGADNERLPQYATEDVLRARAASLDSVTLLTRREVRDVHEDAEGVSVTVHDRTDGTEATFRAAYAVGADGSRSVVRESAGLTQTVFDHDRLMVLLVFQSDTLHRALLDKHPGKSFFNVLHPDLQGYWMFFGRVDLEGEFFFHAPVPDGEDPETFDFQGYVERAVGQTIDMEIRHRGYWDCRVAIADRYGSGRTFIAGDAAHNHPPYGGYGINTGFEDARNLGWKLTARLKGWGGPELLASYDTERRPVFWSTAKDFIEKSIETDRDFLATYDPATDLAEFKAVWSARARGAVNEVGDFQPNYRGSHIVAGPRDGAASAKGAHSFTARPGYHLAPRALPEGGTTHDRLGSGFSLIALGQASAAARFAEDAARLHIPLTVIESAAPGEEDETADYGASLILVRPDQFVAWAGDTIPSDLDANDILKLAIGA
ncbi:FAD-dependent monooxygenase [Chromohalobacter sp. TMW 2.2308]|uniref:FAD-dependent monooxygenase n=1 Tax=Chromohalobacter moromii TaxID=2860329 RepID=A0A9X2X248_9GAMM|nr:MULTISPECIES: FAD-dependent oxidoreductase [Chromohalobacter]MCK2043087.1 FAD-dependent monooxygenase [Chromohalobacter moromii]MCK2046255.1 FAD-dependent monooxygenase [Chromohalobacter moromii]MCT8505321.1 FAD-dependent monooxygenase [Chromohalobacter moromii]MCT8515676.1 FAD-dependent monooxygenase [Chromohalobacter sp. TMW 2.2271]